MNLFTRRGLTYMGTLGTFSFSYGSNGWMFATNYPPTWQPFPSAGHALILLVHSRYAFSDLKSDKNLFTEFNVLKRYTGCIYSLWELYADDVQQLQQCLFLKYGIFAIYLTPKTLIHVIETCNDFNYSLISDYIRSFWLSSNTMLRCSPDMPCNSESHCNPELCCNEEYIETLWLAQGKDYFNRFPIPAIHNLIQVLFEYYMPLTMRLGFIVEAFYTVCGKEYPMLSIDFRKLRSKNNFVAENQAQNCNVLECYPDTCPHKDTYYDNSIPSPCIGCMSSRLIRKELCGIYAHFDAYSKSEEYRKFIRTVDFISEDMQLVNQLMFMAYRIRCTLFHFNVTDIVPKDIDELKMYKLAAEIAIVMLHRTWASLILK